MVMASMNRKSVVKRKSAHRAVLAILHKDVDGTADALSVGQESPEDGKNNHHGCTNGGQAADLKTAKTDFQAIQVEIRQKNAHGPEIQEVLNSDDVSIAGHTQRVIGMD
jgi:hypothetical protein